MGKEERGEAVERLCHSDNKMILWHIYCRAADELSDLELPLLLTLQISQGELCNLAPWCVSPSANPPQCD